MKNQNIYSENGFYRCYVLERDGALPEITFLHLRIDNLVYQVADALFRIFGQAARGCLYGICHHQDGLLLAERVGTGIGE